MNKSVSLLIGLILLVSCSHPKKDFFEWNGKTVWLEHKHDSLHILHLSEGDNDLSKMVLPWKLYNFDYGDLDGDSIPEIAVGVIKKTVYDPIEEKRLFLYQIAGDHAILRLWMGSRVIHRVQDFYIDRDKTPALVHTFEKDKNGIMHEGEYKLGKFGLRLKQFIR